MQKPDVRWVRRLSVFVLVAGAITTLGCGPGGATMVSGVSGKVTLDGQALKGGQVTFMPDADKGNKERLESGMPTATIGSDGSYTIKTGGKDGAPAGAYKVQVTTNMPGPQDAPKGQDIPAKYNDAAKSGLTVEVKEGAAAGAYDLPLKSQ